MSTATRFLIISDTHAGRYSHEFHPEGPFNRPFPHADVLLHAGDLTMTGTPKQYLEAITFLASLSADLKLVIAGNHDMSLHESYYLHDQSAKYWSSGWSDKYPQQARELWTGEAARKAGITYLEEGMHEFTVSRTGARLRIYASPWQPRFADWAFNYPHEEDRWNPRHLVKTLPGMPQAIPAPAERDPHPLPEHEEVDIVMTHGPARNHLDMTTDRVRAGCPHLLSMLNRVRPKMHVCGHIHEAWGAELVSWADDKHADGLAGEETQVLVATNHRAKKLNKPLGPHIQSPTDAAIIQQHAAFVDMTQYTSSGSVLGTEQTLFVNAAILDTSYKPVHAPFLVDLDLRTGPGTVLGSSSI